MSRRGRTFYKDVDVEVEIDCGDVIEYIEDYASESELKDIKNALAASGVSSDASLFFEDRGLDGGLVRQEKLELLSAAYHKFSLQELEQKLGTKFDLL